MEKKRPQLNLIELYQLKWLLGGALALLSAWTALYMDVDAWQWLVLITVSVPVVMRWPALTLRLPRLAYRLAFPLFVALFVTDLYLNREPLPAMIRLALMLVFYRAITPRRRRDDLQLIVLGLFLVVIAGVLSVSLAFALQIVVFTACTLLFLLLINLIDSAESGQAAEAATAAAAIPPAWMRMEPLRLAGRLREAMDWRVAALVSGLFAGVVGLSALLFFALPRFEIGNSFFLDNLVSKQSRTGFSENVRLGSVTDIMQDTSVAMRVDVSDPSQIPADPYWRMLVLDGYENGLFMLTPALDDQLRPARTKAARVPGTARPRQGAATWVFYLEGGTSRYLPALGSFYSMDFNDGPQGYGINDELRVQRLDRTPSKMFAYRIDGMRNEPELGRVEVPQRRDTLSISMMMDYPGDPEERGTRPVPMPNFLHLALSEAETERVRGWVEALGAPEGDARAFARLASGWLASRHAYSLQMNIGFEEGDPLVRWMASDQPGHCELFAGSLTVLGRVAGYPTRMITGFRGGTWNPGSRNLTIRNSDAHAWCEIYDQASQSWVRVDPTPGGAMPGQVPAEESVEALLARISDRSWSAKLDGLRMFWYRRIVDFDRNSQIAMAREAKHAIESRAKWLKEAINRKLEEINAWLSRPWDLVRMAAWLGVVLLAAAAVLGWKTHGRGWWLRWRSGLVRRGADPVRREAGRWLRRLRERETAGGEEAERVRAELERLRYGPRQTWPNPQSAFRRAKRVCRR